MNTDERIIYSVSQLNQKVRSILETALPMVWVEGELSNLAKPASGHWYFSLKDASAQIRCAFFRNQLSRLQSKPEEGQHVIVRARVSLYEARGDYQLLVETMEQAGEGALQRAFEALKKKLDREGLFAPEHKKQLPVLPKRIGVITSPSGAVIHDILTTLQRRFPAIPVMVYPVAVQGDTAAAQIASTITLASNRKDCDVLIIARGGGSLEDLWSFNEEQVARAIFDCEVPVVCGVGHETDTTIADWVADARAPTPTAAAELLSPDSAEWMERFGQYEKRISRSFLGKFRELQQRVDWSHRRIAQPDVLIKNMTQHLHELTDKLIRINTNNCLIKKTLLSEIVLHLHKQSPQSHVQKKIMVCNEIGKAFYREIDSHITRLKQRLQNANYRLDTLSPLATLNRGYAIVKETATGVIVHEAGKLKRGDHIEARLAKGTLFCTVDKTSTN